MIFPIFLILEDNKVTKNQKKNQKNQSSLTNICLLNQNSSFFDLKIKKIKSLIEQTHTHHQKQSRPPESSSPIYNNKAW
jgi:UDP-2,3-diacylglucosamine pyrophosphatase LpxH